MDNYSGDQKISGLITAAWVVMLIGSTLPDIILFELSGEVPEWIISPKLFLLLAFIVLTLFIKILRPLIPFAAVLFVYNAASTWIARISLEVPFLNSWFAENPQIYRLQLVQINKLAVTLVIFVVLILFRYTRRQMYLVKGELNAPITPVKWLGFPKPDPWTSFGGQYSIYFALGIGIGLWITSGATLEQLKTAIPVLPGILFIAAQNAFNEEFVFRSSILATTINTTGRKHAWWLSASFFGIAHFWGVPYGYAGIALATFMGWFLAKAMLETRGFTWSWWVHFLQDVVILSFVAAGSVTPGG